MFERCDSCCNFHRCPSYGDSVGSRPVCGADGNDYSNMCELHKSSCLANRMIEVKFHGACGKLITAFNHPSFDEALNLNDFRSVRVAGMPVAVRLHPRLGEAAALSLRHHLPVGFSAGVRLGRSELQLAVPPDARSVPIAAPFAHPLQGPLRDG